MFLSRYGFPVTPQLQRASHKEIIYLMEKDEDYIQSRIIKTELLKLILAEAEHLPAVRKKIFKLIFVEGLNNAEIDQKLDITIDTVRVQKAKALHALRNVFLKNELLSVAGICLLKKLSDNGSSLCNPAQDYIHSNPVRVGICKLHTHYFKKLE